MSRTNKKYSQDFKNSLVREVLSGKLSAYEAKKKHQIGGKMTVYRWISQYTKKKKSINMTDKTTSKTTSKKSPSNSKDSYEEALLKVEYYEKLISLAKEEYGLDIKKNFG